MIYLYSFLSIQKIQGRDMKVFCKSQWSFRSWEAAHEFRKKEGIDPGYNPLYFFKGDKPPLRIYEPLS
jgi:hypothetical protein